MFPLYINEGRKLILHHITFYVLLFHTVNKLGLKLLFCVLICIFLYLAVVLVIRNISRIYFNIQRDIIFRVSMGMCVCTRENEGQREGRTLCSAKTFLNTAGSVCPVLFIKVVVLRPSAHTHMD